MINNKQIVDGMKQALTIAFSTWLNENKEALLEMVSASMTQKADTDDGEKAPTSTPKTFFTPNELAKRWNFHPVSVLRMLRLGTLPTLRVGRRVLVSVADVEEYERGATLNLRGRSIPKSGSKQT